MTSHLKHFINSRSSSNMCAIGLGLMGGQRPSESANEMALKQTFELNLYTCTPELIWFNELNKHLSVKLQLDRIKEAWPS